MAGAASQLGNRGWKEGKRGEKKKGEERREGRGGLIVPSHVGSGFMHW